jgi:DNA adenine methylase
MFEHYEASDANESVILFLNDVSRGIFVPPPDVTREEYYALKASPSPSALQAFAGVIYSFNGIWFNNYAGSYAGAGLKARNTFPGKTVKRLKPLSCVEFKHAMYHEYADHEGCLFYMDPPYKKRREKYKTFNGVPIPFDTDEFWEFTRKLSKKNTVLVSEYEAPDDFECILEFPGRHGVEKVFKMSVI